MGLTIIENKTFGKGDTVTLDGHRFVACKFIGCTLLFGGGNVDVDGCDFEHPSIQLFGPARNAIQFLRYLRQFSPDFVLDLADVIEPPETSRGIH